MNELSLAYSLLKDLQDESKKHGISTISRIHVKMGSLCTVIPEELAVAFRAASEGTMAEGAELNIGVAATRARCARCNIEFAVDMIKATVFTCPHCGGKEGKIVSGEELEITLVRGKMPSFHP